MRRRVSAVRKPPDKETEADVLIMQDARQAAESERERVRGRVGTRRGTPMCKYNFRGLVLSVLPRAARRALNLCTATLSLNAPRKLTYARPEQNQLKFNLRN
jgi:hypothetical protein